MLEFNIATPLIFNIEMEAIDYSDYIGSQTDPDGRVYTLLKRPVNSPFVNDPVIMLLEGTSDFNGSIFFSKGTATEITGTISSGLRQSNNRRYGLMLGGSSIYGQDVAITAYGGIPFWTFSPENLAILDPSRNVILSFNSLGPNITSSSLRTLGTLTTLNVSGDVNIDSNTLKVDSTNNMVGINTPSPSSSLDVSGIINTDTSYNINQEPVLTVDSLGSGVVNSSLQTLGVLNNVTVGGIATLNEANIQTANVLTTNISQHNSVRESVSDVLVIGDPITPSSDYPRLVVGGISTFKSDLYSELTIYTKGMVTKGLISNGPVDIYNDEVDPKISTLYVDTTNNKVIVNTKMGINIIPTFYELEIDGSLNLDDQFFNYILFGGRVTLAGWFCDPTTVYRLNGVDVLTANTLGSGIVNSSLTSVGTLSSLTVAGDLTVDSTTLRVNSSTNSVRIDGKLGINQDNTFWEVEVDGSININDNLNQFILFDGRVTLAGWFCDPTTVYRLNGIDVLSATTLGTGVVNSSLTSVGTLSSLTVAGDLTVDSSTLKVNSSTNRVRIDGKLGINQDNSFWDFEMTGSANINGDLLIDGRVTLDSWYCDPTTVYRLNGTDVLSTTTLGAGIVNSSLTSVGTLTSISTSGIITSTNATKPTSETQLGFLKSSYITSNVTMGSSGTVTNITSLSLGPGLWSIHGKITIRITSAGTNTIEYIYVTLAKSNSTASIYSPTTGEDTKESHVDITLANTEQTSEVVDLTTFLTTTTTYYLNAKVTYTGLSTKVYYAGSAELTGLYAHRLA